MFWNIWLLIHGWLVFGTYNYSIMVGAVYVVGVLFAFLVLTIMNYFLLPSWSTGYLNLVYMISGFGDPVALHCTALQGIWSYVANLWLRPYRYSIVYWAQRYNFIPCWVWDMASHHIHCIGIWSYVAASSSDRTSTTSFIGHNDAASYLVGYEGRSSCAFICIFVRFCGLDVMEYIAIYYE